MVMSQVALLTVPHHFPHGPDLGSAQDPTPEVPILTVHAAPDSKTGTRALCALNHTVPQWSPRSGGSSGRTFQLNSDQPGGQQEMPQNSAQSTSPAPHIPHSLLGAPVWFPTILGR